MKKKKADRSSAEELRRQAEERIELEKPLPEEISPAEAQRLIHELRVHQIELEMQNDELRRTQEILEESRSGYIDLYDFAPIGYLTLDRLGFIKAANLTAAGLLQVERPRLINVHFAHFMLLEDRAAFRRHLNLVLEGEERQTVELRLTRKDGQEFFARLESAFYRDITGGSLCRTAFTDITARRQAEADLRESEARYRSLFQNNHAVMLLINPATGDLVDANPAACAFYGFSREELTAKKITEINTLSPEQVFAEMELAKKEKRRQFLFRHRLARGEVRDVEVFSGPLRLQGQDLLYSIVHDITARRQAEAALQRQQQELQIILDSVPAMIFYKDKENRFIRTNKALAEATGLSKAEMDGKSVFDLYPSLADDYWKDDQEVIRSSKPKRNIVETMETPEGVRWVQTDKLPYRDAQGTIIGVIGFSVDITERKQAEEALQATQRFLEIANRHQRMAPLLEAFVAEIKGLFHCEAVGIRLLGEAGNIPYQEYVGFSKEFYEMESPLSIKSDNCMCIKVIKGTADPKFPYYTPGGSFYLNGTSRFLATVSPEDKGSTRNVCNAMGYESVALVPIRLGRQILGLIHLADRKEGMVPLAMVHLLEKLGMQLGTAIQRARAEEDLQRAHDELEERVKERTADLQQTVEQLQWEIEERQRTEEALARQAARLQDLYNNAPCGYHSLDQDGNFVQINDTELAWLGYARDEVLGRLKFSDLITADSLKVFQKNFPVLKERGEVRDCEYELIRKDGTVIPVSLSATAIRDEAGHYLMSRSTMFDITERQRAEAEIRKLNEDLEQRVQKRTAELEAINRELDAFSFSVSHDLKAPLRTIQGFSRMLLAEHSSRLDAEGLRLLEVVCDNTRIMSQLVDDLLALSRLGRQQLRKSAINLAAMTNQVFQQLQSQQPERNLELTIGDLPEAFGDHNLIRQVMINLLGNAVKYSKGRKTAAIAVGGWSEGNENIYFVKDNGSGFDGRYADKLFVAFQRLHSRQEFEGTGVGLAIVQRIIHRHGGRVWAEGIVDEGAAFYFSLPKNGG